MPSLNSSKADARYVVRQVLTAAMVKSESTTLQVMLIDDTLSSPVVFSLRQLIIAGFAPRDRELSEFRLCAAVTRFLLPCASSFTTSCTHSTRCIEMPSATTSPAGLSRSFRFGGLLPGAHRRSVTVLR